MHTPVQLSRRRLALATAATLALPSVARAQAGGEPILLGQSAHLSGPLAAPMAAVIKGQSLALDQFNARGGVDGRKVRLTTLDDAYDAKRCVENVNRLIDQDKVTALYGLASTANIGAVLPMLAQKKVPLVGIYSGSPVLRARPHPYFFTTMASYSDEVAQMMRNQKTLLRHRIAILYMDNALGQQMLPVVEQVAKEEGVELASRIALKGDGSDAVEQVGKAMANKPEGMILIAFGPMIVPVIKAWRAASGPPAYAISIANSRQLVAAMGPAARSLAFTQLIPDPARKVSRLARDFNEAMDKAGLPVDRDHYFGFLNMRVMLECLGRAGRNVTSQSLVATIEGMGRVDLGGYTVNYSPQNHHGSKFVDITIVGPDGRYLS